MTASVEHTLTLNIPFNAEDATLIPIDLGYYYLSPDYGDTLLPGSVVASSDFPLGSVLVCPERNNAVFIVTGHSPALWGNQADRPTSDQTKVSTRSVTTAYLFQEISSGELAELAMLATLTREHSANLNVVSHLYQSYLRSLREDTTLTSTLKNRIVTAILHYVVNHIPPTQSGEDAKNQALSYLGILESWFRLFHRYSTSPDTERYLTANGKNLDLASIAFLLASSAGIVRSLNVEAVFDEAQSLLIPELPVAVRHTLRTYLNYVIAKQLLEQASDATK